MAAAAAIPALIAAAPQIIDGIGQAKDIITKYAPTAKRVVNMLFKSHSKSPSHLLSKIMENPAQSIATAANFLQSDQAAELMKDAKSLGTIATTSHRAYKKARANDATMSKDQIRQQIMQLQSMLGPSTRSKVIPRGYHNLLEELK